MKTVAPHNHGYPTVDPLKPSFGTEAIAVRFGAEAAAEFRELLLGIRDLDELSNLLRLADLRRAIAAHANHER